LVNFTRKELWFNNRKYGTPEQDGSARSASDLTIDIKTSSEVKKMLRNVPVAGLAVGQANMIIAAGDTNLDS